MLAAHHVQPITQPYSAQVQDAGLIFLSKIATSVVMLLPDRPPEACVRYMKYVHMCMYVCMLTPTGGTHTEGRGIQSNAADDIVLRYPPKPQTKKTGHRRHNPRYPRHLHRAARRRPHFFGATEAGTLDCLFCFGWVGWVGWLAVFVSFFPINVDQSNHITQHTLSTTTTHTRTGTPRFIPALTSHWRPDRLHRRLLLPGGRGAVRGA